MPATYVQTFWRSGRKAWLWDDQDDLDFITWIGSVLDPYPNRDFAVDRTGPEPELTWQPYAYDSGTSSMQPDGPRQSMALTEGTYYTAWNSTSTSIDSLYPAADMMTGFWESDEYGRPYNLNDLLADTP